MQKTNIPQAESKSADLVAQNLEQLKQIFPEVIKEGKVDFEALNDLLGNYGDTTEERFALNWAGKANARREAQKRSTGTLRPCPEDSVDWDSTENLYIEGDNLEVLKLLQKSYHSRVKMIYIDPPYNTGKDFVYKDNYTDNIANYLEQTGQDKKLSTNTESDGRFHSNWLNMMYPRLKLARNLLTDDGVIFISINDHEIETLKNICNEIYGKENYISTLIWDRNHSAQAGIYKVYHEYVLLYAKNIDLIETPQSLNNDLFEAGAMKKASGRHSMQAFRFPKGTRFDAPNGTELTGEWGGIEKVGLLEGRMISDNGYLQEDIVLEAAYTQIDQMKDFFYGDRDSLFDSRGQKIIEFYLNSKGKVKVIKKRGVETPQTTCRFGAQGPISKDLAMLFGTEDAPFDSPKPIAMLADFISRFTTAQDIILDFFSGSATTADAVISINNDNIGNNRKFILVQFPENLNESLKKATKDSVKTLQTAISYLQKRELPHLLTEIGKERIRLRGKKILEEQKAKAEKEGRLFGEEEAKKLDTGFKVFKLDSSNINAWDSDPDNLETALNNSLFNIKTDRSEDDLLYEILIKYGIELTEKINRHGIDGKTVYEIGVGSLIVCLADSLSTAVADGIGKLYKEVSPEGVEGNCRVVFKEAGFNGSDEVKTNTLLILKQHGITNVATV